MSHMQRRQVMRVTSKLDLFHFDSPHVALSAPLPV